MAETTNCILCNSYDIHIIETISTKHLATLYKKAFNQEVNYLFKDIPTINYCECNGCSLLFFTPQIPGDELFYNHLQKFDWYYRTEKEEYNLTAPLIKPGSKVLEVGSGAGLYTNYLKDVDYTGLEFSENAIKMAAEKAITILNEPVEQHAETHENTYDYVVSFQVLEHVANPNKFLKACAKSLKPGGQLIIAVPANDYYRITPNHALDLPPHHMTRWKETAIENLSIPSGLTHIQTIQGKLEPIHHSIYTKAVWQNKLATTLGYKNNLVNLSKLYNALGRLADILTAFTKNSIVKKYRPKSNTIIGVYQKY